MANQSYGYGGSGLFGGVPVQMTPGEIQKQLAYQQDQYGGLPIYQDLYNTQEVSPFQYNVGSRVNTVRAAENNSYLDAPPDRIRTALSQADYIKQQQGTPVSLMTTVNAMDVRDDQVDTSSNVATSQGAALPVNTGYSSPRLVSDSPIVSGVFPEVEAMQRALYQQKQNEAMQAQAYQFAQLSPMQQAQYSLYMGGQQLGGAIGSALGGKDPQLQQISMRNAIMRRLDPSNPAQQMKIAQEIAQYDPEFAMSIADNARKSAIQIKQASGAARQGITAKVQEAERIASAEGLVGNVFETRVAELLKGSDKSKDDFVVVGNALVSKVTGKAIYEGDKPDKYSAFAQKLIDAGLTPNTEPFQRRMLEHINAETKGAEKGTGNVTIGGISIDTGEAGKAAAKVIGANVANIESQYSLQTGVGDALKLIDKGIYAGAYGPEKGFVAKFSGGMIGDPKKVQNTEVFMANIGEIVIPRLQQFGGNDSNEELKYLQRVVAGDQRLEPESMKRILISAEKKIANNIARLRKQAESSGKGSGLPLEAIQAAPSTPIVTKRLNPRTGKIETIG